MKNRLFPWLLILSLVSSLLLSAAAPMPAQSLARFTVVNKSTSDLSFRLEGPRVYTLLVKAKSTEVFTLERGEYTYWVQGCGMVVVKGTLDMTKSKKMVMPVCGGRAKSSARTPNTIDLSSKMTLVKVELENDTKGRVTMILTGPSTYVFTLNANQEKTVTIAKGEYNIEYYACGGRDFRKFFAQKGTVLEIECP